MEKAECPYCGKETEIDHDDGYGYEENEAHQQECGSCRKTFIYYTSISLNYETQKADCLNGAEHNFKPTVSYPKEATRMRCTMCDKERKPTDDEMKNILEEFHKKGVGHEI